MLRAIFAKGSRIYREADPGELADGKIVYAIEPGALARGDTSRLEGPYVIEPGDAPGAVRARLTNPFEWRDGPTFLDKDWVALEQISGGDLVDLALRQLRGREAGPAPPPAGEGADAREIRADGEMRFRISGRVADLGAMIDRVDAFREAVLCKARAAGVEVMPPDPGDWFYFSVPPRAGA